MKRNFLQAKVLIAALVIVFSVLSPLAVIAPRTALAAGESYTYKDSDNITFKSSLIEGGSTNLKRASLEVMSNKFQGGGQFANDKCGYMITLTVSGDGKTGTAVSYTHLTLPTNREV